MGANWSLLQKDLTIPSYIVHVDDMAGGSDVRFRVVAIDSVNTGLDETDDAISIPNHPPQVIILNLSVPAVFTRRDRWWSCKATQPTSRMALYPILLWFGRVMCKEAWEWAHRWP